MHQVRKAIIPAAGLGSRMHPITSYLPKPMMPLGRKPVLQYIIDEIKEAGIRDILVVNRSDQPAVVDFFKDTGGVSFVTDDSAGGPGEAILKGRTFADGESFLTVFSDAPLRGKDPGRVIRNMVCLFEEEKPDALMAVYRVSKGEASARGIVELNDETRSGSSPTIKVSAIEEKPDRINRNHPWASACRYLLSPDIFDALEEAKRDPNGELQLTSAIQVLLKHGKRVRALPLPEGIQRYDTGNFEGYFEALKDFINPDSI